MTDPWIAAGSTLGALLRFASPSLVATQFGTAFDWGRLRVMTAGFRGGYTTFSAVSLETWTLIRDVAHDAHAANERMARQLEDAGQVVGREGRTRKRVRFGLSHGAWGDMELSVNTMIDDLQ